MPKDLNVNQRREIERMEAYQDPNPYHHSPRMNRLVYMLIAAIVLLGIVAALTRSVAADPAPGDHWICQSAAVYSFAPGALQAEWDNPAQTWKVLETNDPGNPADDIWHYWTGDENLYEMGIMYANPELSDSGPGYIEYKDTQTNLLWRFAFKDLIVTNEGGRPGHHHSCDQGPVAFGLEAY